MFKRLNVLSVGLTVCCIAGVVGCSTESPSGVPTAASVTADGASPNPEGTKAEPGNPRIAKFAELDTNQDGRLNLVEFTAAREAKEAERWFRRRDIDGNGVVNLTEYAPELPLSTDDAKPKVNTVPREIQAKLRGERLP